jgi:hypothetical protein
MPAISSRQRLRTKEIYFSPNRVRGFTASAARALYLSPGTAACFSRLHRRCLARLHLGRDRDLLHHASTGATRVDPAFDLARCHDLKFTSAIAGLTLPALPLLKSHENCPLGGRFSATGIHYWAIFGILVLITIKEDPCSCCNAAVSV